MPRFWATVWSNVMLAGVADGTRGAHLAAVERLYRSVAEQTGCDQLDRIIADGDFDAIEESLGAFLTRLANEAARRGTDLATTWRSALKFINDIFQHLARRSEANLVVLNAKLLRLERLFSQIAPAAPASPKPVRALPAAVVEDLYELFNPSSRRNPFRTEALRWRNFLVFLFLLHLGLRRGELLILPVNAVKEDFNAGTGEVRHWINIADEHGRADPRASAPSLKTFHAQRQLPISRELVELTHAYTTNYRGRPSHPFLLNSQKDKPVAVSTFSEIFDVVTEVLGPKARKALRDRLKDGVAAHDLRHTAAVYRLSRYHQTYDLDTAVEKLRVFFGWSPASEMPRLYARAYFETALAEVWNDSFDGFVENLRKIEGVVA